MAQNKPVVPNVNGEPNRNQATIHTQPKESLRTESHTAPVEAPSPSEIPQQPVADPYEQANVYAQNAYQDPQPNYEDSPLDPQKRKKKNNEHSQNYHSGSSDFSRSESSYYPDPILSEPSDNNRKGRREEHNNETHRSSHVDNQSTHNEPASHNGYDHNQSYNHNNSNSRGSDSGAHTQVSRNEPQAHNNNPGHAEHTPQQTRGQEPKAGAGTTEKSSGDKKPTLLNQSNPQADKTAIVSPHATDDITKSYSGSQGGYVKKDIDPRELLQQTHNIYYDQTVGKTEYNQGKEAAKNKISKAFGIDFNNVHGKGGAQSHIQKVINSERLSTFEQYAFRSVDVSYVKKVQDDAFHLTSLQRSNAMATGMASYKGYYHSMNSIERSVFAVSQAEAKISIAGTVKRKHELNPLTAKRNKASHENLSKGELQSKYEKDIAVITSQLRRKDTGEHKAAVSEILGPKYVTKTSQFNALKAYETNIKLIESKLIATGFDVKHVTVPRLMKALSDGNIGGHVLSDKDRVLVKELIRLKKVQADAARLKHKNSKGGMVKTWAEEGLKDSDAKQGADVVSKGVKTTKAIKKGAKATAFATYRAGVDVQSLPSKVTSSVSHRQLKKKDKLDKKSAKFEARRDAKMATFNKTGKASNTKAAYKLEQKANKINAKSAKIDRVKWDSKATKADSVLVAQTAKKAKASQIENYSPGKKIRQAAKNGLAKVGAGVLKIPGMNRLWNSTYMLRIRNGQTLIQRGAKVLRKGVGITNGVFDIFKKIKLLPVFILGGILVAAIIVTFGGNWLGDTMIDMASVFNVIRHPFNSKDRLPTDIDPNKEECHQEGLIDGHYYFHDCFASLMDANHLSIKLPEEGYHVTRPVRQMVKSAVGDDGIYKNMVVSKNQSGLEGAYDIVGFDFHNYKAKTQYSFPVTVYDRWVPPKQVPELEWVVEKDKEGNIIFQGYKQAVDIYGRPKYKTIPGYWETHQDFIKFNAYTGINGSLGSGYTTPGLYRVEANDPIVTGNNYTEYRYSIKINGDLESFYLNMILMGLNCTQVNLDNEGFWLEYNKAVINTLFNHGAISISYETEPISKELTITYVDPVRAAKEGTKAATQKVSIQANKTIATLHVTLDETLLQQMIENDEITNEDLHSAEFDSTGRYKVKNPSDPNYFEWEGWEGNASLLYYYRNLWEGGGYSDPIDQEACRRQFDEIFKIGPDSLYIPNDKAELLPCSGTIY